MEAMKKAEEEKRKKSMNFEATARAFGGTLYSGSRPEAWALEPAEIIPSPFPGGGTDVSRPVRSDG
jgi:hypothetical protein